MKKSFSQKMMQKKNRGVAVIFTLGILGLLTVMALGFASTALLNRKIADNTSSAEYSRHIAKNIALARAKWVVRNNLIADSAYSSGPISGEPAEQDFLHKMDTILDGVELYRITNDSGTILGGTARWQYVKDSSGKILGRYAYAIVPDSGHLDPVGNRGQTTVSGRYGFSEKEIGVYSLCNGDTGLGLSENPNAGDVAGIRFRTFKEFFSAFKDLSDNNKKNFLKTGYRIQLDPTPDAFWIDNDKDGKKTQDEQYLRFNMPRTDSDWASMTVAQLIGEGAGESDSDIKYTSTTKNSVDFIPWLKYWTHSNGSTWTADLMKKQIAANIIQYNRPGPEEIDPSTSKHYPTVSDQSGDWLMNPPTYAGIGRHPMLNEIGFLVRLKAEVKTEFVSKDDEAGTITYKYQPIYYMTLDAGAELIYPFGPTSGLKDAKISFPNMTLRFTPTKFLKAGKTPDPQTTANNLIEAGTFIQGGILNKDMLHTDVDRIQIQIPGSGEGTATATNLETSSSTVLTQMGSGDGEGLGWSNFALSLNSADWSTSSGYTKANKFWKADQTGKQQTLKIKIRSITLETKTSAGNPTPEEIANAMARRMTIKWRNSSWNDAASFTTPETVVLKYDDEQRDVARLAVKTFPQEMTDFATEKVWFIVFEAKDPLVNHYSGDWTVKQEGPKVLGDDESKLMAAEFYPGTLADSDGNETVTSHLNSTVKDSSGNPVALLKDKEMKADGTGFEDITLESATDPAYINTPIRLSSSYIRHAPMQSFWELGFISRAEAFKTLNLSRVRVFEPETGYTARGGGSFAQGDANILDQIKFSDTTDQKDVQGKIDLNARYHKVFEWVFNRDVATSEGTTVNWFTNLITGSGINPYAATTVAGTTRNLVCGNSSSCLSEQHSGSCTKTCLAHLLMERSMILPFRNRSDLLLDPDSTESDFTKIPGYSDLSSDAQTKLISIQRKLRRALLYPGVSGTPDDNANSKLVREQYATRFMNLFKADDNNEHVYIVVVAQSIKDIGGGPAFVDWNGDGEFDPSADGVEIKDENLKKFLKTGYVRKKIDGSGGYEKIAGAPAKVKETFTSTNIGTYDFGVDKITGETKLIAEMSKDSNTGKWKLVGYRYVE